MSTPINDGGPAFPLGDFKWNDENKQNNGMTLRDWFAGQALTGTMASPERYGSDEKMARYAFYLADAMLAAREVKP